MRDVGTVVRGIRTPIIKEGDDLATIVCDSVIKASKSEHFQFEDRDVIAITEAVVGISEGNYANVDDIATDIYVRMFNVCLDHCRFHIWTCLNAAVIRELLWNV